MGRLPDPRQPLGRVTWRLPRRLSTLVHGLDVLAYAFFFTRDMLIGSYFFGAVWICLAVLDSAAWERDRKRGDDDDDDDDDDDGDDDDGGGEPVMPALRLAGACA